VAFDIFIVICMLDSFPSRADVKKWAGLYLYSPHTPSWRRYNEFAWFYTFLCRWIL